MVSGLPPLFPRIAAFLYLAVLAAHLYYWWAGLCEDVSLAQTVAVIGLLALLIAAEPYAARPSLLAAAVWMPIVLLASRAALYEAVALTECAGFSKFLYLLVPFQAYFSLGRRAGYALGLLYAGILMVRFSWQDPLWYLRDAYVSVLLIFLVGVAFVIVMAQALQNGERSRTRAEQLLGDLERSNADLRASADQVAELATAEERNRLAREIHDSLGHHLTAISVQLEKAIAFRGRNPGEADRAVQDAKHSATAALADVRQSVASLRGAGEMPSLRTALTELVARAGSDRFIINLTIEGDEAGFAQPVLTALFRAAQEGLTNVYRHAEGAGQVSIHVALSQDGAQLAVTDDGCGFDPAELASLPPSRQGRFGLQGLRERVEQAGGRLHIQSNRDPHSPERGTRLLVWLPSRHQSGSSAGAVSSGAGGR